jgi:hypothetical protein
MQVMGVGHEPGDCAEESKRGRDGYCTFNFPAVFLILCVLREDGQASKQESQNYDNDRCDHATYLRCVIIESAKPLPYTSVKGTTAWGSGFGCVENKKTRRSVSSLYFGDIHRYLITISVCQ